MIKRILWMGLMTTKSFENLEGRRGERSHPCEWMVIELFVDLETKTKSLYNVDGPYHLQVDVQLLVRLTQGATPNHHQLPQ